MSAREMSYAVDLSSSRSARTGVTLTRAAATLGVLALSLAVNAAAAEENPRKPESPAVNRPAQGGAAGAARKAGEVSIERKSLAVSTTEKIDYELGTLYVPEYRGDPKSRLIGVGFARFKATTPTGAPPAFHLPGGPGGSFVMLLKSYDRVNPGATPRHDMVHHMLLYRAAADVVLVDQRGFSDQGDVMKYNYRSPEEPLDQPASLARGTAAFVQFSREVVADFTKKGFDLRGYTVKECAEDVNDLRKALGYEKISLVATSFGSQWSFATMRLHPEIVARAVLSGVEPLDNGYDMPSNVLAAVHRYWKEAEKEKALQPYLPPGGLEQAAKEVVKRLEHAPIKVTVKDAKGVETSVTLGPEDFQRDFMHKPSDSPAFVLSLYYQHYDAWAASVLQKRRGRQNDLRLVGPLIDTSLGVTPQRERQLRNDPGTEFLGQWNWDAYIAAAEIWPSPDVGDDFRTPVKTSIPVIFGQGDWDTSTPVENTLDIVKSFPKGRVIIAEHGGHGVLEPIAERCPREWGQILDFLRTGNMPNLSERVTLPVPRFIAPDFPAPTAK